MQHPKGSKQPLLPAALNTGVMLVRNTPWARHFFSEVNRLGRLDDHHKGKNTLSAVSGALIHFPPESDICHRFQGSMHV